SVAAEAGLPPWQVKKVYGLLPHGWRGDERIAVSQYAPRLRAALADAADPARQLLYTSLVPPPDFIELQNAEPAIGPSNGSGNLFSGIALAPGSDARRRLANLPS